MLFQSPIFLFVFLPLFLLCFLWLKPKLRSYILLIASTLFYTYAEGWLVFILLLSVLGNYLIGTTVASRTRNVLLYRLLTILFNLSFLILFKYRFYIFSGMMVSSEESFLPLLGVSFFTFQGMSFCWDQLKSHQAGIVKTPNLLSFINYITFFPQLIAGPIVRYDEVQQDLKNLSPKSDQLYYGIKRFVYGLAMKVLLADQLAPIVEYVYEADDLSPVLESGFDVSFATLVYGFQIFLDFSAYTHMALGLGALCGVQLPENFNRPYIAHSIREFWRRWHMTLTRWFRDYVYIPLGGNRHGLSRTLLNIFIVFSLTGLWHGANNKFLLWGAIYGILLCAEEVFKWIKLPKWLGLIKTYCLVNLLWIPFRASDFERMKQLYMAIIDMDFSYRSVLHFLDPYYCIILALAVLTSFTSGEFLYRKVDSQKFRILQGLFLHIIFIYTVLTLSAKDHVAYIYFKF